MFIEEMATWHQWRYDNGLLEKLIDNRYRRNIPNQEETYILYVHPVYT